MTAYAKGNVKEEFQENFLAFIRPENVKKRLGEHKVISFRYMVGRHGKETWEEVRFASVRHEENQPDSQIHAVGACLVDVDAEISKAMAQNQALKDALSAAESANKAKTAFLSNMSHEIRTPMNAIIGLDKIALADASISEATRDHLEKIGTSAHHLLGIINDILDMSRIESGRLNIKKEEFSFAKTLEQVNTIISGQCRDKRLTYDCRIKGNIAQYYIGDDIKLRQVMINILGNAVKFTPEGGSVTFTVENVAQFDGRTTLRFIISDTGIGMSKEYLPKLFDAFSQEDSSSTSKYGSTGLGMPITKSIVELMNGHIEVESEKGAGTTFTITVTLLNSDRKTEMTGEDMPQPQEMCVLVIDDDPIACEHAQVILNQIGIACEKALSGAEGLEMVKLRHARRAPYTLILVDWKMPDIDGVETTRQIRAAVGNEIPIIILTSYSWDDIMDEARNAGVDTFVAKPLFVSSVMDEFRAAFKKKNDKQSKKAADLEGRRVLLAEDIAINAEIIMMVLSMREMEVDHAENGRIAVEMFESHEPGYYDAILMDMRMPEMDGLEATQKIRSLDRPDARSIPIIALTANAFDEDVQRSMQAGLNAHLSKPVEPEALFETLEGLIVS
ncbi:MAG: response regulator [Mailhella sp.]|nr:response regulator [Mailhella sp.]